MRYGTRSHLNRSSFASSTPSKTRSPFAPRPFSANPDIAEESLTESDPSSLQSKPLTTRNFVTVPLFDPSVAPVQAKLTIGQPNDQYEQEADRVADQVMSMPDSASQPSIQGKAVEDIQAKLSLQRKPDGSLQADSELESQLSSNRGAGTPLPDEVKSFMEPRFEADFSQVRVHTGSEAVQMSRELNAQAFTHKQDVFFGAGKTPAKDALTAHELTHVVQQTGSIQAKESSEGLIQRDESEEEQVYTPADANLSTLEGTEVHVDAPSNALGSEPQGTYIEPADVEVPIPGALAPSEQSDAGAGGSSGIDQRDHEGGAEGAANAPSEPVSSDDHSEESWWDRGIDWAEGKIANGAHALANKAEGIPVLEQVADAGAFVAEQGSQYAGGLLKGAGTMIGGIGNMIANPVDTAVGLEAMAEHIPVMGAPLKAMHGIYDVAINDKDPLEVANHVLNPLQSLEDDAAFYGNVAKGIAKPYQQEIEQGKYAEAAGRGVFDIGGIVLTAGAGAGAEGAATAGRGAAIAGEVADTARVAEGAAVASDAAKVAESTAVASDASRTAEVSDAAKVASEADEAAKAASKATQEGGEREAAERIAQEQVEREAAERAAAIKQRIQELDAEGHGPARHGPQLTDQQLEDRALKQVDPVTGTTDDAYNKLRDPNGNLILDSNGNPQPAPHKAGKDATKITSEESYVKGEEYMKNSQQFKEKTAEAELSGDNTIVVEDVPLEDVYGKDYKKEVYGKTRQGTKKNPTGVTDTDFSDGKLKSVYRKDANGNWKLHTMYPEPK